MGVCARCGGSNDRTARFCQSCGSALDGQSDIDRRRRTVSVLFADLVGSTALGEVLDPETLRDVLDRYFFAMRTEIERHGGAVEKYIGDAILAVFGLATIHEDDALRAVRTGWRMREALSALNALLAPELGVQLASRIGINTGEVVVGDPVLDQRIVTGDPVNVAARLEQAAASGEILLGETTFAIVRDRVEAEASLPMEVRGKSGPIVAYRLLRISSDDGMDGTRSKTPMVGRVGQITLLEQEWAAASSSSSGRLVVVLGEAGVGKSRLVAEFAGLARDATQVLHGRCLSYGDGITFWPIAQIVREATDRSRAEDDIPLDRQIADIDPDQRTVAPLVALLEGSTEYPVEETTRAVRRLIEAMSARGPVIVLVEDLHWAEAGMLDLLRQVATARGPVLLVGTARPEFGDDPFLGGADLLIELGSLDRDDAEDLLVALTGDARLDESFRTEILEAAGGNALFLEQMVAMLSTGEPHSPRRLHVPPSLSALLDARIDQLPRSLRAVLESAAVVGKVFYRSAVEWLVSLSGIGSVAEALDQLIDREFVQPTRSDLEGESAYSFRHGLIADAVYRGTLKRVRAELHERCAQWVAERPLDRPGMNEILGSHLERAHGLLVELGESGDRVDELAGRGSDVLATSGRHAAARGDVVAASNLLVRAASLLPIGLEHARLALEAGEQFRESGRLEEAEAVMAGVSAWIARAGPAALRARAQIEDLNLRLLQGSLDAEEARREVRLLSPTLADSTRARSEMLLGIVEFGDNAIAMAEVAFGRALEFATSSDDQPIVERALDWLAVAAVVGPTSVPEAMRSCLAALDASRPGSRVQASTSSAIGMLESMLEHIDQARARVDSSRAIYEELGLSLEAAATSQARAAVELRCGDPALVVDELEADRELLVRLGERSYLANTALRIAQVQLVLGDLDHADAAIEEALQLSEGFSDSGRVGMLGVRSRILAHRRSFQEAKSIGHRMLAAAAAIDRHDDIVYALVSMADVLTRSGEEERASRLLERAATQCVRKGDRAGLRNAERLRSSG